MRSYEFLSKILAYRTPKGLRAYSKVFLNLLPIIFTPHFTWMVTQCCKTWSPISWSASKTSTQLCEALLPWLWVSSRLMEQGPPRPALQAMSRNPNKALDSYVLMRPKWAKIGGTIEDGVCKAIKIDVFAGEPACKLKKTQESVQPQPNNKLPGKYRIKALLKLWLMILMAFFNQWL